MRANPIFRRLVIDAGSATEAGFEALAVVAKAIDALPKRQRTILKRCDIAGEAFGGVAADLALSERHLFRERSAALDAVAATLLRSEPCVQPTHVPERLDSAIDLAERLDRAGNRMGAAHLFEAALSSLDVSPKRAYVATQLATLHIDAGDFARARDVLEVARRAALDCSTTESWILGYVDTVHGRLLWQQSETEPALRLIGVSLRVLRGAAIGTPSDGCSRALAHALVVRCNVDAERGDLDGLAAGAAEFTKATTATPDSDPFNALLVRKLSAVANIARWSRLDDAERTLADCQAQAMHRGYFREAADIGVTLSGYLRAAGRRERALETARDSATLARAIGADDSLGTILVECAWNNIGLRRHSAAFAALDEAESLRSLDPEIGHLARLVRAQGWLELGQEERALSEAIDVADRLSHLGRPRYVVVAKMLQTEALLATGRVAPARLAANAAFDETLARYGAASPVHRRATLLRGRAAAY